MPRPALLPRSAKVDMWKERIKADFHLATVVMFGAITVLGITPFAVYRFLAGQPLAGTIDLLIVAFISAGAVHAWRTGRTTGAATFLAVSYSLGCIAIAHVAGLAGALWLYPVLVANFLLARRRPALLISMVAIAGVVLSDPALGTAAHKIGFVTTAVVVSLFSFAFASRTAVQRSQLEAIALRDPLTGAGNRRGMEAELKIAMASSLRSGVPLGLLVFDIDHFKQVNDNHGHDVGDLTIQFLAEQMRQVSRGDDALCRNGGEEFSMLLPDISPAHALQVAERLRVRMEIMASPTGEPVTISIGLAHCPSTSNDLKALLKAADEALYAAKRGGRNRVVMARTDG